jgi:hypothetical protein
MEPVERLELLEHLERRLFRVVSWTGNFALLNSAAFSGMVTAESIRK